MTKPPAGTRVKVDIRATNGASGGVDYDVAWHWEDGTPGGKGPIEVPAKKKGEKGTPIDFHIDDQTKPPRGIIFTDDAQGPIWIRVDQCPDDQCLDRQFPPDEIKRSDKQLTVVDDNAVQSNLHYRLRFKDKDGHPDALDPEIKNGGST